MNTDPSSSVAPSVADIERIAALGDPVARNLRITQCYHELARAIAARTDGNANWCAFATWASKQAGQTIRGEDLADALEHTFDDAPALDELIQIAAKHARALGASPEAAEIRRIVREVVDPAAILARAADAVARGNLKVFAEIGREFARFVAERTADAQFDAASIAAFCAGLREAEPPEGQRYLRQAFARYYRALFETNAKTRSELMLWANLEIGLHEQTRLQPQILAALNAAVFDADELRSRVVAALLPRQSGWLARARQLLRRLLGGPTPLDLALGELVARARAEVRRVLTEHLMTLSLSRGVRVRLGSDLRAAFPASLTQIEAPELATFLQRIDPTPDSLRASGAIDWGDLPERMHFIADLFRCCHASAALFDPPFVAPSPDRAPA